MSSSERREIIITLLRQWLDRRERYIRLYPEMSVGKVSLRFEVERDFKAVEKQPSLLDCFMNAWHVKLRLLTIPYGCDHCDTDMQMLQEISDLWFTDQMHMDAPEIRVFHGSCEELTEVYNRLMGLGVKLMIVPNTDAYLFVEYADWSIYVTSEVFDLYQSKYRHAA